MYYKSVKMYEGNKNVFLENATKFSFFSYKVIRLFNRILTYFLPEREVNPVFSERVIEYAILFKYLDLEKGKHIFDFGCVEDILPIHLCSLGFKVTGMDFRLYPFYHKNFEFIQADILKWEPKSEAFDAIVSISTVEHVGLSAYGDTLHKDGDKIAVEKLMKTLKTGGRLYLTVPAGKPCIERGYRVYDFNGIKELVSNIEVLRFFYKHERYSDWKETSANIIGGLVYDNYNTISPAQGVAFIIVKKK